MSLTLPLQNKQVMIPRGVKQAGPFSELVKKLGGIPVEIPLIAFRPVSASEEFSHFLDAIHTYDWVIFTSNVTVETFFSVYKGDCSRFPKVAVIGEKTKEIIEQKGISVQYIPKKYVAESFVENFLPFVFKGMRVFIPKGSLARDYIASSLKAHGAIVDEMVIYETYLPEESRNKLLQALRAGTLDILTFTSPSTIDHFMEIVKAHQLERMIEHSIVACIGPVARAKAEQYGLTVHVCPDTFTVEEMMNRVIDYINSKQDKER